MNYNITKQGLLQKMQKQSFKIFQDFLKSHKDSKHKPLYKAFKLLFYLQTSI